MLNGLRLRLNEVDAGTLTYDEYKELFLQRTQNSELT
jgi:hypothetical protein